jgi:hypothetical protein
VKIARFGWSYHRPTNKKGEDTVKYASLGIATVVGAIALAGSVQAQEFGTDEDAAYAALLWDLMEADRLAGDNALYGFPYEGVNPHGAMLETFYTQGTINGHTGALVVKRNYGPAEVSYDEVIGDPAAHLAALTVMFQREDGYDSDNQNWFWVKYLPDGTLDKNPAGMSLAGRVAKGAEQGCLACHSAEDDYLFTTDASIGR